MCEGIIYGRLEKMEKAFCKATHSVDMLVNNNDA